MTATASANAAGQTIITTEDHEKPAAVPQRLAIEARVASAEHHGNPKMPGRAFAAYGAAGGPQMARKVTRSLACENYNQMAWASTRGALRPGG